MAESTNCRRSSACTTGARSKFVYGCRRVGKTALYSSVLDAVAAGATAPKAVADRAGIDAGSVGKYLTALVGLGIVEKAVPFGEGMRSCKGLYRIQDPFFAFWYWSVSPHIGAIEAGPLAPEVRSFK